MTETLNCTLLWSGSVYANPKECVCAERPLNIIYSESIYCLKILFCRKFMLSYTDEIYRVSFFGIFDIWIFGFICLVFVRFSGTSCSIFSVAALNQSQLSQSICQLNLLSCIISGFADLICNTHEYDRAAICIKL